MRWRDGRRPCLYWAATEHGRLAAAPGTALFQAAQSGMLVGVLPLLLPFTAGCALRLRWSVREGAPGPKRFREALTAAVALAAIGYLMNVLAAGWDYVWAWNVLQFFGLSLVVIALLLRVGSTVAVALAGLLVLIASDPLRDWIPFWKGPAWVRILLGDIADFHAWPFFPWFATVAFGWLIADGILRRGGSVKFRWVLVLGGAAVALLAWRAGGLVPRFDPRNLIGPMIMQPPAVYALGVIGLAAFMTGVLSLLAPYVRLRRYGIVRCFSAGIFWIYLTHMVLGARLTGLLNPYLDRRAVLADPTSPAALVLLVGFPAFLLLFSWLVGFAVLRWLHEKQFRVRLRRRRPVTASDGVTG